MRSTASRMAALGFPEQAAHTSNCSDQGAKALSLGWQVQAICDFTGAPCATCGQSVFTGAIGGPPRGERRPFSNRLAAEADAGRFRLHHHRMDTARAGALLGAEREGFRVDGDDARRLRALQTGRGAREGERAEREGDNSRPAHSTTSLAAFLMSALRLALHSRM